MLVILGCCVVFCLLFPSLPLATPLFWELFLLGSYGAEILVVLVVAHMTIENCRLSQFSKAWSNLICWFSKIDGLSNCFLIFSDGWLWICSICHFDQCRSRIDRWAYASSMGNFGLWATWHANNEQYCYFFCGADLQLCWMSVSTWKRYSRAYCWTCSWTI